MKQFDTESIKNRYLATLSKNLEWQKILSDSTIASLINSEAESRAELARYFEYILAESTWNRARNISTLVSAAGQIGYKPHRKISAIGSIALSHDPQMLNAGSTLFESDFDSVLNKYTGSSISIPIGTRFSTISGIQVITSSAVSYNPYNPLTSDHVYVVAPVIQGITKSLQSATPAQGIPFETIQVFGSNIESASDIISNQFFSIYFYPDGQPSSQTEVTIVNDIRLAAEDEIACDIRTSNTYDSIYIRFGDGYSGKILPTGSIVVINYLETLGSLGNISNQYLVNVNLDITNFSIPLYATNLVQIAGGKDEETVDEIKANAPNWYLSQSSSIITTTAYNAVVLSVPYVSKSTVYSGQYTEFTGEIFDVLYCSAVGNDGLIPDSTQLEEDLFARLGERKSPLDMIRIVEPEFLHIKLNASVKVTSKEEDSLAIKNNLTTLVFDEYNTLNQSFKQPFDSSDFIYFLATQPNIRNITTQIEAVKDLKPSNFIPSSNIMTYEHIFSFPYAFQALKSLSNNLFHCLKIDL
jgi:hypothetical protein